jgi:endoglucanase
MVQRAEEAEIPYQLEVLTRGSTDARAMQLTQSGVIAGCVSIPCRYVHSNSEMVDAQDAKNGVELLLAVLKGPLDL